MVTNARRTDASSEHIPRRPDDVWVGVDVGTQGVRAAAYALGGQPVATAEVSRPPRTTEPGEMTHDPQADWWDGACEVLKELVRRVGPGSVAGVALAGLFPAVTLLDARGACLTPGFLYGDRRSAAFVPEVRERLGVGLTGDEVAPRLLWLQRTRPDVYSRTATAIGPAGYVGFRLTGSLAVDPHSAMRWGGLARPGATDWDGPALARLGIDGRLLPRICRPDAQLGSVTAEAAAATGLAPGTPVAVGTTDSLAVLLGSGVHRRGDAMIYYGSTGTLMVLTQDLADVLDPTHGPTVGSPYQLVAYASGFGTGLERARMRSFDGESYEALDAGAASRHPGSAGSEDGRSRSGSDRSTRWRALLERFGYVLRQSAEAWPDPIGRVVAAGGGSNSRIWCQIVSDITGWTQTVGGNGASTRGAAFLGALGSGAIGLDDGLRTWAHSDGEDLVAPDTQTHDQYARLFRDWVQADAAGAFGSSELGMSVPVPIAEAR